MKIKNFYAGLMALTGLLAGNQLLAQSTITQLLKPGTVTTDKGRTNIRTVYKHSFIKSYELTLTNGVKVVIRADEGRKDLLMNAVCAGGASVVDDSDFQSAMHAGDLISNSGLGEFGRAETSQFFKQKSITLTAGIDEKFSTLKGSFLRDDMETFLQAVYLYFTQPRKDKAYFNNYIKKLEANAAIHAKNPYAVFQDSVNILTCANKNRVNPMSSAGIKQIGLNKAYTIFRKCFSNAHGFTFVFTGNFKADDMNEPPQAILNMIGQYLGALPSSADSTGIIDRNTEIPRGRIYKKIYNGHAPLAAVQMIYSGDYQHADSVNLQLRVLSSLLEKELDTLKAFKGANKASVKLTLNRFPNSTYAINIAFKCLPSQVDKMTVMVHQAIADLQHEVKPDEIKAYVNLRKRGLKIQTFDYVFWRDYLTLQVMNHDDIYEVVHYPYNFYKADEQTLQRAANQFLKGDNYIQAVLLPARNK